MNYRIGLIMGDPCGIGPELVAKFLSSEEMVEKAHVVVIGDMRVLSLGERIAGVKTPIRVVNGPGDLSAGSRGPVLIDSPPINLDAVVTGQVSAKAGGWQLECLTLVLELCRLGQLDGFCFAPLTKEAMHLAGLKYEDELGLFAEKLGVSGPLGEMNTLGRLWTSRVTSHVAFRQISGLINKASVLEAIVLADKTLRGAGIGEPRIAVAGLNPHAGDGGVFGDEEKSAIRPAVLQAREKGVHADGPFPADTIFLKGRDGEYDAIVTMYHDQGQIAMKLMGFDQGVTVHAGLPVPVTTPAHGSAFDIAGRGKANPSALNAAFNLVCSMAEQA